MERKNLINFISAWLLILAGSVMIILPLFNIENVRLAFILIITFYGIINIIKNLAFLKEKEYSGFSSSLSCVAILVLLMFFDINDSPWNLALLLFIWVILMSLTKLKEADYYHDRKNKLWTLNIINLIVFILTGILTTINLYYPGNIQILVLGFFFLINGILDLINPLVGYLLNDLKKK